MTDEIAIDADLARSVVRTQFPELDPLQIERLGEGCDSVAFEVNGTWVFRFPKRADVEQQLSVETKLLRWLRLGGSPIPVPAFGFDGRPSDEFPRHFGGYAKLKGIPANRLNPSGIAFERLAPELGRFLSWLHGLPADEVLAAGVADERGHDVIAEVRDEVLEEFPVLLRVIPDAPVDAWHAFFDGALSLPRPGPSAFALVHNDLAAEHVLVDDTGAHVTGVIDWSDAAIGDRALDFGGVHHWGGATFLNSVLAHYGGVVDNGLLDRARFFAAARGVLDVSFGLARDDRAYVENGVRAIRWALE